MTTPSNEATAADFQAKIAGLEKQLERSLLFLKDISAERDAYHESALVIAQQRDEAENRFVKAREENSELEQEVSDLTNELVVLRKKLTHYEGEAAARRERILEQAKHPMIVVPDGRPGEATTEEAPSHPASHMALLAVFVMFFLVALAVIVLNRP